MADGPSFPFHPDATAEQATQTIRAQLGYRAARDEAEKATRRLEDAKQEAEMVAAQAERAMDMELGTIKEGGEGEEEGETLIAEIAVSAVEVATAASAAAAEQDPAAAEAGQAGVEKSRARLIHNVEALQQQGSARVNVVKAAAARSIQSLCAAHTAEMNKMKARTSARSGSLSSPVQPGHSHRAPRRSH